MLLDVILTFTIFPVILGQESGKMDFEPGIVCNFEVYPGVSGPELTHSYCMKDSLCDFEVEKTPRFPVFTGEDRCKRYIRAIPEEPKEGFRCCPVHLMRPREEEWRTPKTFVPGLKSHLMCRNYLQSACPGGSKTHACDQFSEENLKTPWHPSTIKAFPHLAQIGYRTNAVNNHVWYCLGNLITERFVLTTASCEEFNGTEATHVRLGVDKDCTYCTDPEPTWSIKEIKLFIKHPYYTSGHYYYDIALVELTTNTKFTRTIRPACLLTQTDGVDFNGLFSGYGRPEILIKTGGTIRPKGPKFHKVPPSNIIKFKVKGRDGEILLAKEGRPYNKEPSTKISVSTKDVNITRSWNRNHPYNNLYHPLLLADDFKPFWVQFTPEANVSFGFGGTQEEVGSENYGIISVSTSSDDHKYTINVFGMDSVSETEWLIEDEESNKVLHTGRLTPMYGEDCLDILKHDAKIDSSGLRKDMMFCAMDPALQFVPCNQDWGGALVTTLQDRWAFCSWHIIGLFARPENQDCKNLQHPVVFMNVTSFIPWIESLVFKDFKVLDVDLKRPNCLPFNDNSAGDRC